MKATEREPHLVLETSDPPAYRATVGCNRMRGSYGLYGETLTFSPAAATMMACPEPLDGFERGLGDALAEATGFAVEGETLILKNAEGDPLAIFTAVYF